MEAAVTPQLRKIARWLIDDSSTQAPQARSLLPSSNHPRRHQTTCCGRPASEGRSTDGVEPLNFSIGRSIEGARAVVRMHGPRALIDRACPPPHWGVDSNAKGATSLDRPDQSNERGACLSSLRPAAGAN